MASLRTSPVLAEAPDLLGPQFRDHVERLSQAMKPHLRALDREFARWLRRFGPKQRRALQAVTPGAAAHLLCVRWPLADFFEQVDYNGRRLAKLDLPAGAVLEALREYGRLISAVVEDPALRAAAEQLNLAIVLTLNNAFYQLREAESKAFYELSQTELEAAGQRELLERSLQTLMRFCRAEAGCLLLLDRQRGAELGIAAPDAGALRVPPPAALAQLSTPRQFRCLARSEPLLVDPRWQGRFQFVWSIPLIGAGGHCGAVQFAFAKSYDWLPRELKLLTLATERCLLASEKLRLSEDLAAREEQLRRLAGHMIEVEEGERRRISRELHDEAGQSLLYLRLQLELLERGAAEPDQALRSGLAEARELIDRTVLEMRRLISDLSPAVLEQLGLGAAVRQLANRLRQLYGIEVRLQLGRLGRLAKPAETLVYRLAQECCNNIARHAAASHVNLSLSAADGYLKLRVEDDGAGFRMEEAGARRQSFGLPGMRERVALAGGSFSIDTAPGRGTVVAIELPLAEASPRAPARHGAQAPAAGSRHELRNYAENPNSVGR